MSYGVGLRNGVAFALGTIPSLTSGGGLRPSLLLNFLSGTLDSRITFSRGTQATQYTSNGTLQYAPNNLLTYSNQADNAAWTKSNSFVQTNLLTYSQDFTNAAWSKTSASVAADTAYAPDGTLTADVITSSGDATVVQVISGSANVAYTGSVWLRSPSGNRTINIYRNDNGTGFSVSPVTVTAVWQRFTITATSSGTATTVLFQIGGSGTFSSGTVLEVWGAQLVQGSVPGNYVATTSAALPVLYADYQGNLRARKLCESSANSTHSVSQGITTTATPYTFSVYAKQPSDGSARRYFLVYHSQSNAGWVFDLQTGTLGVGGTTGVSAPVSYAITSVGNGWYRCQITVNATAASNSFLHYLVDNNGSGGSVYTGDGSSGIYIADAQLEAGSTVQAYNNTTSAAYYGPRFDYEPVTKVARGLLIEEQRANLLLNSENWNATWSNTNITVTAAATTGPDGTLSATKLAATASAATLSIQSVVATATSHTYSIYAKQGSAATDANLFAVYNNTTATVLASITINYSTGVITNVTGTGSTATNVGNGWWRIQIPVTSGITVGNSLNCYACYVGGAETAGEFAYVYGAQLEAGAFATSYIPTVGSQVTRAADSASITTLTPWYNSAAGTWYAAFQTTWDGNADQARAVITGDSSASKRYLYIGVSQSAINSYDGTTIINPASGDVTGTASKAASTYTATARTITNNAVAVVSGAVAAGYPATSSIVIGQLSSGNYLCGWVSAISYYPTALPNATLQGLTV